MKQRVGPVLSSSSVGLTDDLRGKSRRRRKANRDLAEIERRSFVPRNDLSPRLDLVERQIETLRLPKRRVRKLDPVHVREVANAIRAFGFTVPVLITADGEIIDGVVRVEAGRQAGLETIACIVVDHLSETELRLLRLAVNRLSEKGAWDIEALQVEFEELVVLEAPVEISGFDLEQIDQILLDDGEDHVEQGPVEPEADAVAITRHGDIWHLGDHRLVCGDAREPKSYGSLFDDGELARLVLTDEPFNVKIAGHVTGGKHREFAMASGEMSNEEFLLFNRAWMEACLRHVVDGGLISTFIDWRGLPVALSAAASLDLDQLNLVVWAKSNAGRGSLYRSGHELLPIWKSGTAPHVNNIELGRHGRWRSNVWTAPGASSLGSDAREGLKHHPTVKPVALLEDAILDLTRRGEIVIDPFLGSGSTLVAAEKTGRICRGCEFDTAYCDLIVRRWSELTGKEAILAETGETFAHVGQRRAAKDCRDVDADAGHNTEAVHGREADRGVEPEASLPIKIRHAGGKGAK